MQSDERLPGLLRQMAQLEELDPGRCTNDALEEATSYDHDLLSGLMDRVASEELAVFDPVRGIWQLTSKGLETIETV